MCKFFLSTLMWFPAWVWSFPSYFPAFPVIFLLFSCLPLFLVLFCPFLFPPFPFLFTPFPFLFHFPPFFFFFSPPHFLPFLRIYNSQLFSLEYLAAILGSGVISQWCSMKGSRHSFQGLCFALPISTCGVFMCLIKWAMLWLLHHTQCSQRSWAEAELWKGCGWLRSSRELQELPAQKCLWSCACEISWHQPWWKEGKKEHLLKDGWDSLMGGECRVWGKPVFTHFIFCPQLEISSCLYLNGPLETMFMLGGLFFFKIF